MIPIGFPLLHEDVSLAGKAEYVVTGKKAEDIKPLLSYTFTVLNNKDDNDYRRLSDSGELTWIRFLISNKLSKDTVVVLKADICNGRMILYEQVIEGLQEIGRSGSSMPISQLSIKDDNKRIRMALKARQTHTFLLKKQCSFGNRVSIPVLQSEGQAIIERQRFERAVTLPRKNFLILLSGFHLAIFFFSLIKFYSQKKDKAYLFYSLFNGFTFLLYFIDTNIFIIESKLWDNLKNDIDGSYAVNTATALFYVAFQVELLQLKTSKPKIVKWIKLYAGVVLLGTLLTLIFNQLQVLPFFYKYSLLIFQSGHILGAGLLMYLTRFKQGFFKYIFYGSISLLTGCCIFVSVIWTGLDAYLPAWLSVDFLLIVPVVIEVLFFLMALVYRDKLIEIEKIHAQQQLVEQLEKNKMLQNSFTRNLEEQIKEKTEQLIFQRSVMETEREAKLVAEFDQKLSESELKALRSQINPHFIFNVLNTIESYALQNKSDVVSDMIQKFSKLTRLVLENSMHPVVPLQNDLEGLKLYIELEQMRYNEKFEVRYAFDEDVLEQNYLIPPMIVQPYVENAILHGLRNLTENDGLLTISAYREDDYFIITIEDNGVGRLIAAFNHNVNTVRRNSVGMKLTENRITVFNKLIKERKAKVVIQDLERGTKVMLYLPAAV